MLENQYYGPTQNAEIASKNAYAQWLPAQLMAQAIASPGFATLDKTQQNSLLDRYKSALNAPIPANNAPPSGGGALNALLSFFSKGQQPQGAQNSLAQPGMSPQAPQNGSPMSGAAQNEMISNPGNSMPAGAGYGTPAAQQNAGQLNPGSNPNTPISAAENAQAAGKAAVLGQTANQNAEQLEMNKRVNVMSTAAVDARKALQGFHQAYLNSSYKGPKLGDRPSSGPESIPTLPGGTMGPEQLADTFKQQFLQATADMQSNGGGVTDDARALLNSAKGFGRHLDKDAEKVLYDSTDAKLERMENSRRFLDKFYDNNKGATVEEATAMMNQFNRFAPAYDYEHSKRLPKNEKKFKDFTSPKALLSYQQSGEYNPYKKPEEDVEPNDKSKKSAIDNKSVEGVIEEALAY